MRLAIVSDSHLGYGKGTPRAGDAFLGFKQALEMIVKEQPDAIIHPGDLFDHKIPEQETWNECFELFHQLQHVPDSKVKITHLPRNENPHLFHFHGIPVIAIAGTHEYRSKDQKSALQVLHTANFLVNLHASHALIEKENGEGESEKVAVHGMMGIPEKRALEALRLYNPQPLKNVPNLLVLHQSIKEFLPSKDDMVATIGFSDLPNGFDLLVNGHLHWTSLTEEGGKRLLIPGSTVFTQMKRLEGQRKKGWYMYNTQTKELKMHHLPLQRRLFYHKIKFKDSSPEKIIKKCRETIVGDLAEEFAMPPLYRLKLVGTLAKGYTQADIELSKIVHDFEEKAIFSCAKRFDSQNLTFRMEELRQLHQSKVSISSLGIEMLEKNLQQTPLSNRLDVKRLFELLEDKTNVDKVVDLLEKGELVLAKTGENGVPTTNNSD